MNKDTEIARLKARNLEIHRAMRERLAEAREEAMSAARAAYAEEMTALLDRNAMLRARAIFYRRQREEWRRRAMRKP